MKIEHTEYINGISFVFIYNVILWFLSKKECIRTYLIGLKRVGNLFLLYFIQGKCRTFSNYY